MMRGCMALLLCVSWGQSLANSDDLLQPLPGVPQPQAQVLQIDGDVRSSFQAALHDYDVYLARNAHDVIAQLQRCQFIDQAASTYEYSSFGESLGELGARCIGELQGRFPEHPELLLLDLQQRQGQDRLAAAERVLAASSQQAWTNGQLARLHVLLANVAEELGDQRAGEFARQALGFDERSDVRVLLARALAAARRGDDVVNVLTGVIDGHDPNDGWYLTAKMQLLADVAARSHVLAIYAQLRERQLDYDALSAARALRQVEAISEARWELQRLDGVKMRQDQVARERFRFELDFGSGSAALAAYNDWRAAGWQVDPLAINRMALMLQRPWLPWQLRDAVGIGMLLLALAGSALLAAVPVALVHYRGLARRAAEQQPYPYGEWSLRHAWLALICFVAPSILSLYFAGPLDIAFAASSWSVDANAEQLSRIAVAESFLTLLLLLPLVRLAPTVEPRWWGANWSVARSVAVGVIAGLALRLPALLLLVTNGEFVASQAQQPLWQLLTSLREQYGPLSAFWLLVVFAPVVEEFVFRGVLLKAFAAHLRFGWANVVQAALFSLMHMDLRAAPGLFLLALTAGWLGRRSGGLLAPMVLHAVFNIVVSAVLLV